MSQGFQRPPIEQSKLNWFKSCRDAYRQFLDGSKEKDDASREFDLPFFYMFNSTWMALFRYQNGKQICMVVPSQTLMKRIDGSPWLKYRLETVQDEFLNAASRSNKPNDEEMRIEDNK